MLGDMVRFNGAVINLRSVLKQRPYADIQLQVLCENDGGCSCCCGGGVN